MKTIEELIDSLGLDTDHPRYTKCDCSSWEEHDRVFDDVKAIAGLLEARDKEWAEAILNPNGKYPAYMYKKYEGECCGVPCYYEPFAGQQFGVACGTCYKDVAMTEVKEWKEKII